MPTYDYCCDACGYRFEEFQSITASPLRKCPTCGRRALKRLLGTGGGIIFKGSGFHHTDYRSESYKKAAEAEKTGKTPASDAKDTGAKNADQAAPAGDSKKSAKPASDACKAG